MAIGEHESGRRLPVGRPSRDVIYDDATLRLEGLGERVASCALREEIQQLVLGGELLRMLDDGIGLATTAAIPRISSPEIRPGVSDDYDGVAGLCSGVSGG